MKRDSQDAPEATVGEEIPLLAFQRFIWDAWGGNDELHLRWPNSFLLIGPLSAELLSKSMELVVVNNDALRIRVVLIHGEPRLRFAPPEEYHLEIVDLSNSTKTVNELEERIRCEIHAELFFKIALEVAPLFKTRLYKLAEQRHVLVGWRHHLLMDGYDQHRVWQELWASYANLLNNGVSNLEKRMQYSEYCAWQAANSVVCSNSRQMYWKRRLAGTSGIIWPGLSSNPVPRFGPSETAQCVIDQTLTWKLRERARHSRIHLQAYVLAAYASLIRDWCNQRDFVIATMMTARVKKEQLSILGYLVQPLYLRVQLGHSHEFDEVVTTVSREYIGSLEHMDFGQVASEQPHLHSRTLFQWQRTFGEQVTPAKSPTLGFRVEEFAQQPIPPRIGGFDFLFAGLEADNELTLATAFRPDVFPRNIANQLLQEMWDRLERFSDSRD